MELAQKETLFDYIVGTASLPEPVVAYLFRQFIEGMATMHASGLCHRDIKCENILLDDNFIIKIADFGYSAAISGKIPDIKKGELFSVLGTKG